MNTTPVDLARERRLRDLDTELTGTLATGSQELVDRTTAFLDESLPAGDDGAVSKETQITLRLPQELLDRAEALVPAVEREPNIRALGQVKRAAILRLALAEGLAVLEHKYPRADKPDPA